MAFDMASKDVFLQVASAVEFMVTLLGHAKKALFGLIYANFLLAYRRWLCHCCPTTAITDWVLMAILQLT